MVNFTLDQIKEIMKNRDNIRNMSVIAHVDHGKTTLTDSLIIRAGLANDVQRLMDTRKDEKERGITIKSTGVSLYYEYDPEYKDKPENYLINLIDSPGHVDFSSEVTAALRVTDGALVVVDYVEGVCVQTETVLRQALTELIKPVMMINKVDRAFNELKHDDEQIYQNFARVIENANVIISTYENSELMESCQVNPLEGNVAFGSAKQGWGFTLNTFARMYSKLTGKPESAYLKYLWGDYFYNSKTNKWQTEQVDETTGQSFERGFCKLVLGPIKKLYTALNINDKETYSKIITDSNILISEDEFNSNLKENKQTEYVMKTWINASDALLEMIILHLPSPIQAQKYRTQYLYEGNLDDECAQAMMNCDPNGPVMMFISKMIPANDSSNRFYAFGRLFSGTIQSGQKVRILGPNFKPGETNDLFEKNIQKVILWMGKNVEEIGVAPCGNTCGLVGIDQCIMKQGTISDSETASTIRCMKYSVSPIVRIAVKPKKPSELEKLVEGLKKMSNADPLVQVIKTDTEYIVAGCGELHLEICLSDLVNFYCGKEKLEIVKSQPLVPYKETVSSISDQPIMCKSANKHNKFIMTAEPLDENLVIKLEDGLIKSSPNDKNLYQSLINDYSWDQVDAKKIWCFGPENKGPNVIVDQTSQVQYLHETKELIENAFQWSSSEGVLCGENMRGIRFNILDATLHADVVHRGGGQIIPTAQRLFHAAQLSSQPRYQEPVYLVIVNCPNDVKNKIHGCFSVRKGIIFEEEEVSGTPQVNFKGYLPVSESFGFMEFLRSQTSGKAFAQTSFDHWELIKSDPLEKSSRAYEITLENRKRKGMKIEIPNINDFIDKA